MMKVLIADDERRARERLRRFLQDGDVEIVAEAIDGLAALDAITRLRPDAAFLDVEMPRLNGFEVLAELRDEERPLTVFVTAFDDYAVQAFDVSAVDYLVKPVERTRVIKALTRLRERHARADRMPSVMGHATDALQRIV